MRRIARDQRQCQPRLFAARQLADLRRRLRARKTEPPQLAAHGTGRHPLHRARHMLERGVRPIEFLDLILGEVTDLHLARRRHIAIHRGKLRRKQPCQRRLAVAVAPQQRNPVVGVEPQVQLLQDRLLRRIADRCHVERDQRRLQFRRRREIERQGRIFRHFRDGLHPRQGLLPRLRLFGGRGPGGIAGDIVLQLGALVFLRRARRRQLRHPFGALRLECVVTARIQHCLATLKMQDVIDDIVQQVAFMADHHHRRAITFQERLQPHRRFEVEVVRRFVEQQQVGFAEQQRGQRHAHLPPTRKTVECAVLIGFGKAQPDQNTRRARRRGMRVDGVQPLVQLADAVDVFAGLGFEQQRGALHIGGQHRLYRRRLARRRFLRDIADAAVARHFHAALVGIVLAGDRLHQRRLARAIAPDQPDARARRQRRSGVVEDRASAKAHGDAVEIEHDRAPNSKMLQVREGRSLRALTH